MNVFEILENNKNKRDGLFVDDANLFYIQRKVGWKFEGFTTYFLRISKNL